MKMEKVSSIIVCSSGEEWKKIRSAASKQVIPRRVGNFVEPLSDIADEFVAHLGAIKDESGNVYDLQPELDKWAFQGNYSHTEIVIG